ncbi:cAMP-binding domain of CRP or a regulatory subunit of cAMP-dependent protein kinases [Streptoalloteichus tenebrarius]|uniref:cAMP-binding domain of CRP or a regulatory subunit of cAMP-dependent protein kinases n=1 Tax=Streptoalloteichus tenebrarius (strain ATCC 17920 / DSM 40477 / JCM 4838 / CBS 697.72 / NBRC 16177 / NCIMB 11028 / NRRL B-12390 / A12253. 1 / ISP 5477) TaxID=1933 RepID=A0ABT1HZK5_STRSD|nr:Crp/Fnr family transcriptional regulator [Streptoalloteichus tenebrarius]MCP2260967.1 cAMP-binding domain of CRP or a regulatory subunit of cAMP-dependent protein kinases [Streptoalloteichus tenebrarius]BFE98905.1 Crp/Fnr family transcriptional regulator [Streptoalloteichus tenebrarius]
MHDGTAPPRRGFHALLGDSRWHALLRAGFPHTFSPGSTLVRQGDEGGFVWALASGRVAVLARQEDGAQLLVSLRGAGDLLGEMAVRPSSRRTATVEAIDRCVAHRVPAETFHRFLEEHDAQGGFSDYLVAKLSETVPYQVQLVHFTPLQRVARLLLEVVALADATAVDRFRVPFSQEAVAAALGLARSTVAEQIARLRREGALASGRRLVVSDSRRLAHHSGITT